MSQELRTPIEMTNVSAVPSAPPDGTIVAYAESGKFSIKDPDGSVVTLEIPRYNTIRNASDVDMNQRSTLKITGATLEDDASNDSTNVSIATDYATVDGHGIANGSGTELPQRPTLKITGATLEDDEINNSTNVSIATDYATIDGHGIIDETGTSYTQRGRLIFRGSGIATITDEMENDATAITVTGGGEFFDISAYVSNCVMEMPNGAVTLSGGLITLNPGIKVLIPNGRNADGTHRSVPFTLESSITASGQIISVDYGLVFLKDDDTAINMQVSSYIVSTEAPSGIYYGIHYDPVTNISNEYRAGVLFGQFMGVPVAKYHNGSSYVPEEVFPESVPGINNGVVFKYWEDN
jgi:hypothetical protein